MDARGDIERALTRLGRRLGFAVWIGELCRWAGGILLVGGAVALLLRALLGLEPSVAAWALAPLLLAPALAWWRARGRVPERAELAAWLDRRGGGSGALVTILETGAGAWSEGLASRAGSPQPNRLRLRWRLLAARLAPGLAFAALALWLPLPGPAPPPGAALLEQRLALELREKLGILAESVTLEERVERELERRVERLAEQAGRERGGDSFLEAADSLRERLESLARETAATALRARERLAAAGRAAQGSQGGGAPEAARGALEDALRSLREAGLERHLSGDLARLAESLAAASSSAELPAGLELDRALLARLGSELDAALARALAGLERGELLDLHELLNAAELGSLAELVAQLEPCEGTCREGGT